MLNYKINMLNKNWKHIGLFSQNARNIPDRSGIYLIIDLKKRVLNVPIGVDVLYAGKATKLKDRFRSHYSIIREHNKKLSTYLQSKILEFWFIEVDKNELNFYETTVIKEMDKYNPNLTNILKMKTKKTIGEI